MRADHPNGAHTAYGCQGGRLRTLAHFDAGGAVIASYGLGLTPTGYRRSVTRADGRVDCDCDALGNRLDAGTLLQDNRLTQVGGQAIAHHANGNRLCRGADNCAYDGRGRRLSKTVAGQLRESLYDGQQIVAEHDSRGQPLVSYSHRLGLDEVLMQHRGADTRYHHSGPQSQHPCAYALISPTNDADATGKSVRVE